MIIGRANITSEVSKYGSKQGNSGYDAEPMSRMFFLSVESDNCCLRLERKRRM